MKKSKGMKKTKHSLHKPVKAGSYFAGAVKQARMCGSCKGK